MLINKEKMDEIHKIQIEILKSTIEVCKKLNLTYFMVHGSLLGTVTTNRFIPLDDDIDIAMPREDYEKLIKSGNSLINQKYFIQSNKTDKNYPLSFAKVRDNQTTYIADVVRNFNMHHGIFIDIFPIDFYPKNKIKAKFQFAFEKIFDVRISKKYSFDNISKKKKLKQLIAVCCCPSWYKAIKNRENLQSSTKISEYVRLTGGKPSERRIPAEWFSSTIPMFFEGVEVLVPQDYDKYLTQIYGDYKTRTLLENKIHDENNVEINAYILDTEKPYNHYL